MPSIDVTVTNAPFNVTASLSEDSAVALLAKAAAQAAQTNAEQAQSAAELARDDTLSALSSKADQTALDATDAVVATKADSAATTAALALKADQSSLDTTNTQVSTKADAAATTAALAGKADQSDLTLTDAAVAANAAAIAAIDLSGLAAQEDMDTLEAVVIEGLGNLATDIAANTNAIASVSINYDFLLNHDLDLAGNTAGPGESDPEIVIDLATGFGNHDLDS